MIGFTQLRFWLVATVLSVGCVYHLGAEQNENSPFLPPDSGQPEPPSAPVSTLANLQFASVMSFGSDVLISVFDLQTRIGVWIPVGGEAEGIRVVTYDPDKEEVTVLSLGITGRLTLREAKNLGRGMITALPTMEQEYGRPLTEKEQEFEARMLVSDLLEIGMEERKRQRALRRKGTKRTRSN
jgi:hypothetical protein